MSGVPHVGLDAVLGVAIALFGLGLFAVLARRSAAGALAGAALMIQAAGIELIGFHHFGAGAGAGAAGATSGPVVASLLAAAAGAHGAVVAALVLMVRRRRS